MFIHVFVLILLKCPELALLLHFSQWKRTCVQEHEEYLRRRESPLPAASQWFLASTIDFSEATLGTVMAIRRKDLDDLVI